ncbi:PE-PPE domain-containing protein [[Mycobacterium] nativiensis]|uniref:PE-PPE domain-containing protein n=1 Tax=[Mycobacterium] nativiensis TaxID=2855503 RepID=A0ABU5XUY5_9MYCO|nr:PE-PPE domain-containing protein [Mycolicibacter sp. MYC340]MEB3031598.1 PE-PPE domain-containing protein [Mycolicibacter sp. MYC340]
MTTLSSRNPRSLGAVSMILAGIVALGVAPAVAPGLAATAKSVVAETTLLDTESWIMGGSGLPVPPPAYLAALTDRFLDPATPKFAGQPLYPVDVTNPLFTPEGLYPLTGVKSLPLDTSLAQGVSILHQKIMEETAAGNNLVVLGYSQSGVINALEIKQLLSLPEAERPTADQLSFVMLGSPSTPDGGLLSRFYLPGINPNLPELSLPSLGVTFSGGTPADTPWDTTFYTQEYDGFADFPKYPLNFLADINAFMGIMFVHGTYPMLTDEQLASAIALPVSDDYTGNTQYFMIPTENLPLLMPLRGSGFGNAIADLLQPALKVLVNLGYGDIEHGWSQGPADVTTPFGLFPDVSPQDVFTALVNGAQQGWSDFTADLQNLSSGSAADLFGIGLGNGVAFTMPSLTDIVNALTSASATLYSTLLPTADILNALFTTLPAYTATLFAQELASGDLLNAIGLPLAASTGLVTMAAGFELEVMMNAFSSIQQDFAGLFG